MFVRPRPRAQLGQRQHGDDVDPQYPGATEDDGDDEPIPDPRNRPRGPIFWIIFAIPQAFTLFWIIVFVVLLLR